MLFCVPLFSYFFMYQLKTFTDGNCRACEEMDVLGTQGGFVLGLFQVWVGE